MYAMRSTYQLSLFNTSIRRRLVILTSQSSNTISRFQEFATRSSRFPQVNKIRTQKGVVRASTGESSFIAGKVLTTDSLLLGLGASFSCGIILSNEFRVFNKVVIWLDVVKHRLQDSLAYLRASLLICAACAEDSSTEQKSSSTEAPKEPQPKNWMFYMTALACVVITQLVAYFATPQNALNRKGVLNLLAFYSMLVQWFAFVHAGGFLGNERTEKYYDLTGSFTYLSTLAISLLLIPGKISVRQMNLSLFVAVWSARLGWFLFDRIRANSGTDSRFTEIKASLSQFLMVWTLQGMWAFITMLPLLMLNLSSEAVSFGLLDYVGIPLSALGFVFECVADLQKRVFRQCPENKDKFIQTGLWSISRHPNYFGEMLSWTGVALSAFGGLSSGGPRAAFVFLSPIYVAFLLNFVSGIPLLEKKSDEKFKDDAEYIKYKENTPVLVPSLRRAWQAILSFLFK